MTSNKSPFSWLGNLYDFHHDMEDTCHRKVNSVNPAGRVDTVKLRCVPDETSIHAHAEAFATGFRPPGKVLMTDNPFI